MTFSPTNIKVRFFNTPCTHDGLYGSQPIVFTIKQPTFVQSNTIQVHFITLRKPSRRVTL